MEKNQPWSFLATDETKVSAAQYKYLKSVLDVFLQLFSL